MADRGIAREARYTCLWEYEVPAEAEQEFLAHYAPGGSWTRLFGQSPGYLATELYRDRERRDRFISLDHWRTEAAFRTFRNSYAAEYEALDRACERLTRREAALGELESVAEAGSRVREQ